MARRAGRFARIGLDYADHPKIARLSDAAFRAHMTMILYARRFMTDGRIPKQFAKQFAEQTLEELLTYDAGNPLLTQDGPDDDYWLHDFADWQETRAEIEEKSQVRRVAGAKGGRVRSQNAKQIAKQSAEQVAEQTDSNLSSKTQAEKEKEKEILVGAHKRATRIPPDWKPTAEDVAWQRSEGISDLLARREHPRFVDYWLAKAGRDGCKLDWSRTWHNWLRRAHDETPEVRASARGRFSGAAVGTERAWEE